MGLLPSYSHTQLEARIGSRFNAILIDYEGCIGQVLQTDLIGQLDLILMEEDGPTDYAVWHRHLLLSGFTCAW